MLFTQAQWFHLGADKRSEIQDHARAIMETMERDLRMIGYGVPSGSDVGGVTNYSETWKEVIAANGTSISFTADIDNGGTMLTADAGSSAANEISVLNPSYYASVATTPIDIILTDDRGEWADLTVNGISGNVLTTSANIPSASTFSSNQGEIFSLERVFYRMTGDGNADGICDSGYPFCTIQRQEFTTNDPRTETAGADLWEPLGEYVYSFRLNYEDASGANVDTSVAANLPSIAKIVITLECRSRWLKIGDYQSVVLSSNVLVRNRAL